MNLRFDLRHVALIASLGSMMVASTNASAAVHLSVTVPAGTPADASLFIAGSLPAVGEWKADGLKLQRQPDGTFAADLALDAGQTLEFKITRGSWETVEKNADGSERANRVAKIEADTKQIDVTVERWSAGEAKPASSVVGTLELRTIESKSLGGPRTIRVWLPPGYAEEAQARRYDVLYLHDGQNCFDRATSAFGHEWQIDETLTKLIFEKKVRPIIVVSIDNGGAARIDELTYDTDAQHRGGHAATYAAFLLDEVKPFVEKSYRVETGKAHTFLGGSSLGGLVSLEIARRHPETFGGVIAMSPSLWWNKQSLTHAVEADAGGLSGTRIWLDIGTREASDDTKSQQTVDDTRKLDEALTKADIAHHFAIDEGAAHNEEAWARRFPEAIQYLLGE